MSYCAITDVEAILPVFMLGSQSAPKQAQITVFIAACGAEIDVTLKAHGLAVPVTSPAEFLAELLALNAQGAAARVLLTLVHSELPPAISDLGPLYWQSYQARLMELREGIGLPEGLAVAAADLAPRGFLTDLGAWNNPSDGSMVDGFGDQIKAEPVFQVNKTL